MTKPAPLVALLLVVLMGSTAHQQEAEAPKLTEAQRWHVVALLKDVEVAQLRLQLAQKGFDEARAEASRVLQSLRVAGFTLDVASLTYRADASPP